MLKLVGSVLLLICIMAFLIQIIGFLFKDNQDGFWILLISGLLIYLLGMVLEKDK